jgi:hypothetical protein
MILSADVLSLMLPTNEFIEFCRVLVAFLGALHLLIALHRFLNHQAFWTGIAFMATGLLTALQQIEAIGDPLVPWRLPLYALMNAAGIVFMYKLGHRGHEGCAFKGCSER